VFESTPQPKNQESSPWSHPFPGADAGAPPSVAILPARELPDVTGFFVVVLVTLGLFVVPVGATIMQGPAIVASLFAR
jgi:hypothetical protein